MRACWMQHTANCKNRDCSYTTKRIPFDLVNRRNSWITSRNLRNLDLNLKEILLTNNGLHSILFVTFGARAGTLSLLTTHNSLSNISFEEGRAESVSGRVCIRGDGLTTFIAGEHKNKTLETPTALELPTVSFGGRSTYIITCDGIAATGVPSYTTNVLRGRNRYCEKWSFRFDGGKDPLSFMERVKEMTEVQDFLAFFLPPRYFEELGDQIRKRQQKPRETFRNYVIEMQDMMQHLYIWRNDFKTLDELIKMDENYEVIRANHPEVGHEYRENRQTGPRRDDRTRQVLTSDEAPAINPATACRRSCYSVGNAEEEGSPSTARRDDGPDQSSFAPVKSFEMSDSRLIASVCIGVIIKDATIDTGASKSYISETLARQLRGASDVRKVESRIRLANGVTVDIKEAVEAEVSLEFGVMPGIMDEVLLGLDFLKKMKVEIRCADRTIVLETQEQVVRSIVSEPVTTTQTEEESIEGPTTLGVHKKVLKGKGACSGTRRCKGEYIRKDISGRLIALTALQLLWFPRKSYAKTMCGLPSNAKIIPDAYPLPRINNILDRLRNAKYISTIDLKNGYWQIPMSEESKKYTAFTVVGKGLFQWKVMPFGLTSAPATFQRTLDRVIGAEMEPWINHNNEHSIQGQEAKPSGDKLFFHGEGMSGNSVGCEEDETGSPDAAILFRNTIPREARLPGALYDEVTVGTGTGNCCPVDTAEMLKQIFSLVKNLLTKAARDQTRYYNLRRRVWKPEICELVLVKEHHLSNAGENFAAKLAPKYEDEAQGQKRYRRAHIMKYFKQKCQKNYEIINRKYTPLKIEAKEEGQETIIPEIKRNRSVQVATYQYKIIVLAISAKREADVEDKERYEQEQPGEQEVREEQDIPWFGESEQPGDQEDLEDEEETYFMKNFPVDPPDGGKLDCFIRRGRTYTQYIAQIRVTWTEIDSDSDIKETDPLVELPCPIGHQGWCHTTATHSPRSRPCWLLICHLASWMTILMRRRPVEYQTCCATRLRKSARMAGVYDSGQMSMESPTAYAFRQVEKLPSMFLLEKTWKCEEENLLKSSPTYILECNNAHMSERKMRASWMQSAANCKKRGCYTEVSGRIVQKRMRKFLDNI
ncbi:Polyprotein P3 [Lucilia cuprina]|nr:Polyprotein P3 [Lucilia cuprina]